VLRRKQPDLVRPYRTLGYPVVPILFIVGAGILLATTAVERPRESAMGIGLIVLGVPFYAYWKRQAASK
jgi:APA family basic amino acid/polyamine antiporter